MPQHPLVKPLTLAVACAWLPPALADSQLPEVAVQAGREAASYQAEVAVSATKTPAPLRDIPQTINVVTERQLQDQGARSLQDALRTVPGVGLSHGDGQRDQVTIRGFSAIGDQFVDGFRDDALYFRDLSNIERIEVVKGPAAVLYGRGSSGGLINRISKKPGGSQREVELVVGSDDLRRLGLDLAERLGEAASVRLTGAVEDSGSYRSQGFVKRENIAPSLAFRLGADTRVLLQAEKLSDRRVTDMGVPALNGRPVDVPRETYYGSANAARDDTTQSTVTAGAATIEHRFSPELSLRNAFRSYTYHLDRHSTIPGTVVGSGASATVRLNRSDVTREDDGWFNQLELSQRLAGDVGHQLLYGLEVGEQQKNQRFVRVNNLVTVALFNPVLVPLPAYSAAPATDSVGVMKVAGGYLQDLLTLSPHWKALLGLRYDIFRQEVDDRRAGQPDLARTDREWSPRAGIVFQPDHWQSYYLSWSRSFQPSGETLPQAANANELAPEETSSVELGSKLELFDGQASAALAVFELERSNIKTTDPANPARLVAVGVQRTRGAELSLQGQLARGWQVQAGYAYLDARIVRSNTVSGGVPLEGKRASLTPGHSGNLWLLHDLGGGFNIGGGVNYVGNRYAAPDNTVSLGSYVTADAALLYKSASYDLALNVKNLADKKYYVSAHGDANNLNLPGAPRSIEATLRMRF